jgi:hypothetical protein
MKLSAMLIALLKGMGVEIPAEKATELETKLADFDAPEKPATPPAAPPATGTSGAIDAQQIAAIVAESMKPVVAEINAIKAGFTEWKSSHDEQIRSAADQAKTQRETQIKETLDKAIADGRIPQEKRDEYAKDLEANYDLASKFIQQLPANPAVKGKDGRQANGQGQPRDGDGTFTPRSASILERAADPKILKFVNEQVAETNASGGSPNDTPAPAK